MATNKIQIIARATNKLEGSDDHLLLVVRPGFLPSWEYASMVASAAGGDIEESILQAVQLELSDESLDHALGRADLNMLAIAADDLSAVLYPID